MSAHQYFYKYVESDSELLGEILRKYTTSLATEKNTIQCMVISRSMKRLSDCLRISTTKYLVNYC